MLKPLRKSSGPSSNWTISGDNHVMGQGLGALPASTTILPLLEKLGNEADPIASFAYRENATGGRVPANLEEGYSFGKVKKGP